MEAQVESSYNQPSGEPRNQGQQALKPLCLPISGLGPEHWHRLLSATGPVCTQLLFLLWKVSVKALRDFSPHRSVELAGIVGTRSP